ncbi:MAG: radical SAM protein [Candidatus Erginobacter occultus]|nr:radical SAM protein [Candidatus Erginobacter occultus]
MADVILAKFEPVADDPKLPPPFGILYLADALEQAGFSVRLFHSPGNSGAVARLVEEVAREKPAWVGFSNFTISPLAAVRKASVEIRKKFKIPVVWGGIHSTIFPRETLEHEFVDIVSVGEGEESAVELTKTLLPGRTSSGELAGIQGIGFKKDGKPVINPPRRFIQDLDRYSPAWHLLGIEKYLEGGGHSYDQIGSKIAGDKVAAIVTSRGCPFRCGYCYNLAVNRRTFRAQSPDKVLQEVEYLKSRGVTALIFEDDNFFTDRQRGLEIIRRIGLPWSCSIRADCITRGGDDFIRELREHQCFELRIGVESGSQKVLDLMNKDITVEQVREAIALCSKHQIRTLLNFMAGIPGETWPDVLKSLDLIDELGRTGKYVTVSSVGIFAPWPGTSLSRVAAKMGFQPPQTLEGWSRYWAQRAKVPPYADRRIKFIGFYRCLIRKEFAAVPFPFLARFLRRLALFRWKRRFFSFPVDYYLPAAVLRLLRRIGLSKISRAMYE